MDYWNEGDRTYAFWDADEYFYPATIIKIEGDDISIRFDTGEEEWTDSDFLEPFEVEVDEQVECKSAKDDQYYDVVILNVDGDRVEVGYDDDTTEWTTLSRLRFYMDEVE